jgi:hypothetical protein
MMLDVRQTATRFEFVPEVTAYARCRKIQPSGGDRILGCADFINNKERQEVWKFRGF